LDGSPLSIDSSDGTLPMTPSKGGCVLPDDASNCPLPADPLNDSDGACVLSASITCGSLSAPTPNDDGSLPNNASDGPLFVCVPKDCDGGIVLLI